MTRFLFLATLTVACTAHGELSPNDLASSSLGPPLPETLGLTVGPIVPGADVTVTVSGAQPGATVRLITGTAAGAGPCPSALGGDCVGITTPTLIRRPAVASSSGDARWTIPVPSMLEAGDSLWLQGLEVAGAASVASEPTLVFAGPIEVDTFEVFEVTGGAMSSLTNGTQFEYRCLTNGCAPRIPNNSQLQVDGTIDATVADVPVLVTFSNGFGPRTFSTTTNAQGAYTLQFTPTSPATQTRHQVGTFLHQASVAEIRVEVDLPGSSTTLTQPVTQFLSLGPGSTTCSVRVCPP